ncbi:MAG TPA: SpoIID/LytB domain-containing protein [Vicinamibacterales bacterium]|nr:SpoIID/LytB domain-containing protein [Vicinamibacterales bacterium]
MRRFIAVVFGLALAVSSVSTRNQELQSPDQNPPPAQSEQERLEEEFIQSKIANGESHASGARPELGPIVLGNPTTAVVALRVGLNASTFNAAGGLATEFASLHHTAVDLANTAGSVKVVDRSDGKEILLMEAGTSVHVEHDGTQFLVSQDGVFLGGFAGPILFRPDDPANRFRVDSIRRTFGTTQRPLYRGAMEVARGSTTAGLAGPPRFNLLNIVEVEDYVPGVVANESIASFSPAALRAQAVAARGYAIANIGNYVRRGYPFDIVDSSASQVYRGVISEHANAVLAAGATYGLVASANGRIISAMYSSSFGGHSDSNEWISFTNNVKLGGTPTSYLRGIYDGLEPPPDFSSPAGIDFFWRSQPPAIPLFYDDCAYTGNGFSRWRFTLPASVLKTRLTTGNSTLISGTRTGPITNVEITERSGSTQRAVAARLTLTTGVLEVRGWESLRQTIGRTSAGGTPRACGTSTIAANFVLNSPSAVDVAVNPDGTAGNLTVYGGGWGHNLGMSQYGAHGRGKAGFSFVEILKAYYTGVDIGSYPIDIGREPGTGPPTLRQEFAAPNARGTLQIRAEDLRGLRVHVNGLYDLSFDEAALSSGLIEVDLSPYLVAGLNVIQYNPVGRAGRATVNVVVQ